MALAYRAATADRGLLRADRGGDVDVDDDDDDDDDEAALDGGRG